TCIGSHNKNAFKAMRANKTDQPVKAHLIVCDYQYDEGDAPTAFQSKALTAMPPERKVTFNMGVRMIDPALDGSPVGNSLQYCRKNDDGTWGPWQALDAGACVKIASDRTNLGQVVVTLPGNVPTPTVQRPITVAVSCNTIKGPYLG